MISPLIIFAAADPCKPTFFGLIPWYQYLNLGAAPGCDVTGITNYSDFTHTVPLVMAAVVDDLLRIAGLVAVGYVIVGAIKYITSQGSPEGTANAQGTIINALVGLALALTSVAIIGFIGNQLGGSAGSNGLPQAAATPGTVQTILSIVFGIAGALALLMITVSGMRYITSAGDPQKAAKARSGVIYAMVGLTIALSAEAIVAFVVNRL